jgi:DNA-binding transcriptional MerR regulator
VTARYAIGDLSRQTGTKVQTIRYYEQIGVMPEPVRTAGGQRRYGQAQLDRLAFVRHGRELGFSLKQIRELLELSDRTNYRCAEADRIAWENLREVRRRIKSLSALEEELERMVAECDGGQIRDCRVIEVLSDHGKCLHEAHDFD